MKRFDFDGALEGIKRRMEEDRAAQIATYGLSPDVECHWCGDTGIGLQDREPCWCERGKEHRARRRHAETWLAAIPVHYQNVTVASLQGTAEATDLRRWIQSEPIGTGTNLVLSGAVGVGKTHAAIALLRYFHDRDIPFARFDVLDLMDRVAAEQRMEPLPGGGYTSLGDAFLGPTMEACRGRSLLLLDDLGAERRTSSGFREDVLYQIINARFDRLLPTIVTTNLDGPGLTAHLGDRLASRLLSRAIEVPFSGTVDRRMEEGR